MTPEKKYPKYPYECKHPLARREYLPNASAPKMITCLDCGAILYMQVGDQWLETAAMPLAAMLFGGDHEQSS